MYIPLDMDVRHHALSHSAVTSSLARTYVRIAACLYRMGSNGVAEEMIRMMDLMMNVTNALSFSAEWLWYRSSARIARCYHVAICSEKLFLKTFKYRRAASFMI